MLVVVASDRDLEALEVFKTPGVIQEGLEGLLVLPVVLLKLAYIGPGDIQGDDEAIELPGDLVVAGEVALGALVVLELYREGECPGLAQDIVHQGNEGAGIARRAFLYRRRIGVGGGRYVLGRVEDWIDCLPRKEDENEDGRRREYDLGCPGVHAARISRIFWATM